MQTLALCPGTGAADSACTGTSPAIDGGDDAVTGPPDNPAADQRCLPRLSGAPVNIRAYEVQEPCAFHIAFDLTSAGRRIDLYRARSR
jgi:hypothetical protein